jgi:hypothetical protein
MRTNRREKQDTRRRQEQEFRNELQGIIEVKSILPERSLVPIQEVNKVTIDATRIVPSKSNIPLVMLAYSWGVVGIGINGWFAWSRGTALIDKVLMSSQGFIAEATMFFLLTQAKSLWKDRQYGSFIGACLLWPILFAYALTSSQGFASLNLAETSTVRAERITPAVADAQRRLDTISALREKECLKIGDRCIQLRKDEQLAFESLREARDKVMSTSDPQIASAAKLIAWASLDRFHPSADDFAMLRLLLLTLLPQLGGLVLMVAKKAAP